MSNDSSPSVPCIVLAGGRASDKMQKATNQPILPLVEIAGRPMLSYVIDALARSQSVSGIWVVGPAELRPILAPAVWVQEAGSMLDNIRAGISACRPDAFVLLCTADVPFLTPEAVDDFVSRAVASGADMCYPIVAKEVVLARYPVMRRTFVRTRDGAFTGGNMVVLRTSFFPALAPAVERVRTARKSPLRLAAVLGPIVILRLVTGTASVADIEARAAKLFGGSLRALVTDYAEIAADVDDPSDLKVAQALITSDLHDVPEKTDT
ncbi:MAG: nucleotidyltransferase family protein [Armatimonadota bacterium]